MLSVCHSEAVMAHRAELCVPLTFCFVHRIKLSSHCNFSAVHTGYEVNEQTAQHQHQSRLWFIFLHKSK